MLDILLLLALIWVCSGCIRAIVKVECDELPNGFINNLVFYLIGGPFCWVIGIGVGMYHLMEFVNDNLENRKM